MSFENMNQIAPESEKMEQEKAHEEANMLKAKLEFGKEPTREDYEVASQELDELKQLAEKDPEGFNKLMKYATRSIIGATMPFAILGTIVSESLFKISNTKEKGYVAGVKENIDFARLYFAKDGVAWTEAQRRLKALEHEGGRIAEDELNEK